MNAATRLAIELIDKDYIEKAKERLKHAQKYGINHKVWNIYGTNTSNYPNYDRGFFDWLFIKKRI